MKFSAFVALWFVFILTSNSALAAHPWTQFAGCYITTEWNGIPLPLTSVIDKVLEQNYSTFYYDAAKVDIPSLDFLIFNPGDRMTHFSSAFERRGSYTQNAQAFQYIYEGDVVSGFYNEVVHLRQELSILRKSDTEISYHTKIITKKQDGQILSSENKYLLQRKTCH